MLVVDTGHDFMTYSNMMFMQLLMQVIIVGHSNTEFHVVSMYSHIQAFLLLS